MRYDNREKSPGKRQSYLALLYDFTGKELTKQDLKVTMLNNSRAAI